MHWPDEEPQTPTAIIAGHGTEGPGGGRRLLARVAELDYCEHDLEGFAIWIATRPDRLLYGFCYQAAQVLADEVRCASCGQQAGDPGRDAIVVLKVNDWLGAHFYLCKSCTDLDLRFTRRPG